MHNRWFHLPKLHSPAPGNERKVGWLELFYDLIYVATIIQLGTALSNNVGIVGFVGFAGLMAPLWYAWTGFTFYSNRFIVDDVFHRMLVFLQMFGIGALAISVPHVFEGDSQGFAWAYAGVRLILVVQYARLWIQEPRAREMTRRFTLTFGLGFVIWAASAWVPAPWVYLVWAVAMGVDVSTTFTRQGRELLGRYPPDVLHFTERYGLLIIIVLGESFVKVLTELADRGVDFGSAVMGGMSVLITCCLWWIYFDDVAGSRIRVRRLAPIVWVYAHLPLAIAVTATGVAIKKAVAFEPFEVAPAKYRWLLCGTLALALLTVSLIDAYTERRQAELSDSARVKARFASAVLVLLLAPTGAFMDAWAFVAMVVGACVLQVIFDVSMAPLASSGHGHDEDAQAVFGRVAQARAAEQPARPARPDISAAVRRGTPNEYRRDLYFHFMEGSWTRVFGTLVVSYFLVNTVFAALYLLEPGSVQNMSGQSFLDAFFFSVQTMSTIGYGIMAPQTTYAHVLVTLEAAFAVISVALVTGLVFAKASRPSSAVLFSNNAVVTTEDGKRVLMFRVGNARGNEIVEANVRVVVMKDEVSPEGHKTRRLYDLRLRRETTPLFVLSWTVSHEIDETSCFYGMSDESIHKKIAVMVATLTGHDGTYAQTIHARKMWYPEHFHFDHCFVDIISTLEDGRLVIDYGKFHDVTPEPGLA